jgi:hypothetical protein
MPEVLSSSLYSDRQCDRKTELGAEEHSKTWNRLKLDLQQYLLWSMVLTRANVTVSFLLWFLEDVS